MTQPSRVLSCCVLIAMISGCTVVEVKPWQRNILAKPVMAGNADSALAGIRDHVFFSKEGATGTASAGGGGCGCN